ncbi:RagB/SusD family nutrient uptake outer membrane protein [Mariniradius saccharolyticus]|uniref:RagB/SusD family nutrient uptake outer membrane protein n=1 Tax=Mariniradius saccharolyticus TaxID=1245591 RepID=UPI000590E385|nr:RagB/SusD family nutrient uptake outer membrane protein [Mariniradius saccharolyticus]
MLRLVKSICVGGFVALATTSCWELEQEVLTGLTADDLANSPRPELIDVLKQGAYASVIGNWGGHGGMWSINEVSSDQLAIPQKGADWEDGGIWLRNHRHTWAVGDGAYNGAWQYCYGIVAQCNLLMSQYPTIEGLNAELRVLRALAYLWLIDNFGNVPIILETDRGGNPPQNTRQEVFNFIESSIKDNVDLLPKTFVKTNLNYYSAHMILAKLYLNAEVYTGVPKWAEAEAAIDVVINSGGYSLEPNFFANFSARNSGSSENIFTLPYDANNAGGFNIHHMTFHYGNQATFQLQEQPWNGYTALEEFYNSFEPGDARRASLREGQQFAADGRTPILDNAVEPNDPDGPTLIFTPRINELAPNALRQAGTRINKFEVPLGSPNSLDNDFPIFRLADAILMKAEAAFRLGRTSDALALVNQVRARANAAPLSTLTADILLAERGRELFAEGHRRSDLIRFGRFNDAWWEKNPSQPFRNLFPIPQNQLQANPNLTQNPGY